MGGAYPAELLLAGGRETMTGSMWCNVTSESPRGSSHHGYICVKDHSNVSNGSNSTNTCYPFCVYLQVTVIGKSEVRYVDLLQLIPIVIFVAFLLVKLVPTVRKLRGSLPLFKILYFLVFLITALNCLKLCISMSIGYKHPATKVSEILLRGSILMTELSVVIFGLFFRKYSNHPVKLVITFISIIATSVIYVVAEGLLELKLSDKLACHGFHLFLHGGMIFLFVTSILFAVAYLVTFVLYLSGLYKKWNLPSKKSFYRYALFLAIVNTVQAIGSMLWYQGHEREKIGHSGICLVLVTTFIYVTTLAPMVYWIFLSNYFRMNMKMPVPPSSSSSSDKNRVDANSLPRRFTTNPKPIRKRSYFEEQTAMIAGSVDSSSSYGTLDEEEFVRVNLGADNTSTQQWT